MFRRSSGALIDYPIDIDMISALENQGMHRGLAGNLNSVKRMIAGPEIP